MKRIYMILVAVLLTATVWAQSPEAMSYQAVIRNSSNELVTSQNVGMQISILQGSATGTAVYTETHTTTTNVNGLVSIEIGNGTTTDDFSAIDWASDVYFIKTETDPTGGTAYTITGISQLLSVPYALYAKTAETVTGGITETDPVFTASEAANITATDITNLGNLSGVNTGDQDLSTLVTKTALGDSTAQVRSEIPDVSGFLTSETDPTYSASQAVNITATDITNLGNLSGTNTGDQDLSTLATKAYVDSLLARIELLEEINPTLQMLDDGFTDPRDNNHYDVVKIGSQIWLAENLRYLPEVQNNADFATKGGNSEPAYGVYGYDGSTVAIAKTEANYSIYGVLYNWYVVDQTNVCPDGWHVPTDAEWTELTDYLGGTNVAGGKLKEIGTTHWSSPNTGATDEYGFQGLPNGYRNNTDGTYGLIGDRAYLWSETEINTFSGLNRVLEFNKSTMGRGTFTKSAGLSVRCVKD